MKKITDNIEQFIANVKIVSIRDVIWKSVHSFENC